MQLSIIIPSKNRAEQVRTCVKALTWQTLARDKFEIVVVDDGSTDNTLELLDYFKKQYPDLNLRVVSTNRQEEKFKAGVARNFGANHANGKILLFIDSDIIAEPHMLEYHLNYFNKYKNVTVMGYRFGILFPFQYIAKDLVEKGQIDRMGEFPLTYDIREPQKIEDRLPNGFVKEEDIPWRHYHSHNIAVTKEDFWAVGGFDESFSGWGDEDLELGYRLWKKGLKFVFDREIIGFHLDHFAHRKEQLVSEYQNKRQTLLKHQDLEIDLFNDDTNPLFWTRNEKNFFEDLRNKPYEKREEGLKESPLPQDLLDRVECVVGEGEQLSNFTRLKYLINFREKSPSPISTQAKHIKIIGSLLPFKGKQFKTIVIYNYLELFPDYYAFKIVAEALRVAEEVYVFHPKLNEFAHLINSFTSNEVTSEIVIESILDTNGYAKLAYKEGARRTNIPINIVLNSFTELNDNSNLIKIAVWLDKLGYNVNVFSVQFNFRFAFERATHLFRTFAGFFYRKMWDYLDTEDQKSVNIHSQLNPRWNHGVNLPVVNEAVLIKKDLSQMLENINERCESVFLAERSLGLLLKKAGLKLPILDFEFANLPNILDTSGYDPEFIYPLNELTEDTVKNLCVWLEAFIQVNHRHPHCRFNILLSDEDYLLYMGTETRGLEKSKLWNNMIRQIKEYNDPLRQNTKQVDIALRDIINIYLKALPGKLPYYSSLARIGYSFMQYHGMGFFIEPDVPNTGKYIKNRPGLTVKTAANIMQKKISSARDNKHLKQFLADLDRAIKQVKSEKTALKNIWGFLKANDFKRFGNEVLNLSPARKDFQAQAARAIHFTLIGKYKEAKALFTKLPNVNKAEKWLRELIYAWYGYLLLLAEKKTEALEMFERCLAINPGNLMAIMNAEHIKQKGV